MTVKLLRALLVFPFWMSAQNSEPPSAATHTFDTPLEKKIVDLGPSRSNRLGMQNIRIILSCYYFPNFVVKQYDSGQKGAEWLAITPPSNGSLPACTESHGSGERVIDGQQGNGYFRGVKENLVFFNADDGYGGGLPFCRFRFGNGEEDI